MLSAILCVNMKRKMELRVNTLTNQMQLFFRIVYEKNSFVNIVRHSKCYLEL